CAFDDGSSDRAGLAAMGVDLRAVPLRRSAPETAQGLLRTGSLSAARFWSSALRREVERSTTEPADLLQVEYAQLAPYADRVSAKLRVLDLHNVESSLVQSYGRTLGPVPRAILSLEAS